jgi:hypothetical protein
MSRCATETMPRSAVAARHIDSYRAGTNSKSSVTIATNVTAVMRKRRARSRQRFAVRAVAVIGAALAVVGLRSGAAAFGMSADSAVAAAAVASEPAHAVVKAAADAGSVDARAVAADSALDAVATTDLPAFYTQSRTEQ